MEIRTLEYFLQVAREENITKAASSLHLSQPALSTQLKALEEELGVKLLIRGVKGSRRVLLTEEGIILKQRAEEILSLVKKTESEVASEKEGVAGEIFIGAGETETIRIIAKAAKEFRNKNPFVSFHISSGNADYVLDSLDKGLIDFGLLFREPDDHKYEFIELPLKDRWGLLMRKDFPLSQKESIKAKDIIGIPLITSHQKGEDELLSLWMGKDKDKLNIVATYNLLFNASILVEEGLGCAICYDKIIHLGETELAFRPFDPPLEAKSYLVWKKYQILSKASSRFLEELKSSL